MMLVLPHKQSPIKLPSKSPYIGELYKASSDCGYSSIKIRNAGKDRRPGEKFFVMVPNKRGCIDGVFETVMPYPRGDAPAAEASDIVLDLTREAKPPVLFAEDEDTPLKFDDLAVALAMKRTRRFITVILPPGLKPGQALDVSTPKGKNNVKTTVPPHIKPGQEFVVGYEALVPVKKEKKKVASSRP